MHQSCRLASPCATSTRVHSVCYAPSPPACRDRIYLIGESVIWEISYTHLSDHKNRWPFGGALP